MNEPTPAPTPAEPGDASSVDTTTTSTGLDPNVAGLLAYLGVIGIVLFFLEKQHREVRFHAAQNTVLCLAVVVVYIALSFVSIVLSSISFALSALFGLVNLVLGLAMFALWVYLLIQGYRLNHVKLPVIGDAAEKLASNVS